MSEDPIYGIIRRKRENIDCAEYESAEVKGWLRDVKLPFEQPTFNDVKELFPIEYSEFLDEVEISYKERLELFNQAKPERKFYLIVCNVANVYRNDYESVSDKRFIELAKAQGLVFTEAEFIKQFNTTGTLIDSRTQFLRML